MKIAAIYIEHHEYLFNRPQSINFGGKYFYEFYKQDDNVIVKRKINPNYIDGFFILTDAKTKVSTVNAIVGQNGSGKSSLLDIIRSIFIEYRHALPHSECVFLAEIEGENTPYLLVNDFDKVYLEEEIDQETKRTELTRAAVNKVKTIYYSPHFDYKYNPNFDNYDDHDISFDRIIEEDLEHFDEKDTNERGFRYSPNQELLFKNSLRQIEFLTSDLVSKQEIFKDIFYLPDHYEPTMIFRGYLVEEKNWNTPTDLRYPLEKILEKIEAELKDWHTIRKFEGDRVINEVEVSQYILKRNVIKFIISLLYRQMERRNTYLREGVFSFKLIEDQLDKLDAYSLFLIFIEHAGLRRREGNVLKLFENDTLRTLLVKIYEAIESVTDKDHISSTNLKTSKERTVEILQLQRKFLNELNRYYFLFHSEGEVISDRDIIEEFINYMPFSRRMSSGENALLNFFSRLYHFINFNFIGNKFFELKEHYVLLLDEADLSFHPKWKRRYVKALLKTIPYFFDGLSDQISIQIIFTTHDPLTLSDLPNANVIYMERRTYDSPTNVLDYNDENRPTKTFGANISDLLADSFFVEDSLIGDFAFDKIQETIQWLEDRDNTQNSEYYEKIIKTIDEPIVQRKLAEMFDDKMQTQFQLNIVNDQIRELEALRNRLQR